MDFEEELIFEAVENCGFRFGSKNTPMLFIPCYSEQNVFYSTNIEIFYNGGVTYGITRIFEGAIGDMVMEQVDWSWEKVEE